MPHDLDVISEIIREAGDIVLKHYEAGATADQDKDGEPVTIADRESDVFIVDALRRAFPDDEIVSEESLDALVGVGSPSGSGGSGASAGEPEAVVSTEAVTDPAIDIFSDGAYEAEQAAAGARGPDSDPPFQLEFTPDAEPPAIDHAPPRVWYVDPMDGTSDFVKRTGDFVVMIGLAIAGWPVLGAVYHPLSGTLYRGGHGIPAEKIVDGERTEMRVSEVSDAAEARLVVSRSHTPDNIVEIAEKLGITQMEKCGSVGLKAAQVAEGVGEIYLHASIGTKLWDSCAPEAILIAAGGSFSDCDGKALMYDKNHLHNERGIFASNGRVHDAVLEAVKGSW